MMPVDNFKKSYTYADIGIVPTYLSDIDSRSIDCNTNILYNGLFYELPIIVAPMKSITNNDFIRAALNWKKGILCTMYRTKNFTNDLKRFNELNDLEKERVIVSVGIISEDHKLDALDIVKEYQNNGARMFCVDVANGFNKNVGKFIESLKALPIEPWIIAGNVGSVEGYRYLSSLGVESIRVGIGSGSACTTSIQTGIGYSQASLIRDVAEAQLFSRTIEADLIADGGIRNAGDICTALALGADFVMCGGIFAKATLTNDVFFGEASEQAKEVNAFVEGESYKVEKKIPLEEILKNLQEGIKSFMSYIGVRDLADLSGLPDENFRILSPNSVIERGAHGKLWNK